MTGMTVVAMDQTLPVDYFKAPSLPLPHCCLPQGSWGAHLKSPQPTLETRACITHSGPRDTEQKCASECWQSLRIQLQYLWKKLGERPDIVHKYLWKGKVRIQHESEFSKRDEMRPEW